jgi:hypothetical protein
MPLNGYFPASYHSHLIHKVIHNHRNQPENNVFVFSHSFFSFVDLNADMSRLLCFTQAQAKHFKTPLELDNFYLIHELIFGTP